MQVVEDEATSALFQSGTIPTSRISGVARSIWTAAARNRGPNRDRERQRSNGRNEDLGRGRRGIAQQIIQLPLALGGVGGLRSPEAFVFLLPGNSKEAPSVEALQKFKVTRAIPDAQYGRIHRPPLKTSSRSSGTNDFHGTIYDLFKNEAMDPNTWFNNGYLATTCTGANDAPSCRAMYARPQDKKNDYGVEVDGPLVIPHFCNGRNKLLFLYSWEQFRWSPPAIR